MNKSWLLLPVLLCLIFGQVVYGYAVKPEPDSFAGIKWGTDIGSLKNMIFIEEDKTLKGLKFYGKENEDLKFGGANIETIAYMFFEGKFCGVYIVFKGDANFTKIKNSLIEDCGKTEAVEGNKHYWKGSIVEIDLDYDPGKKQGFVGYVNIPIYNKANKLQ